MSTARSCHAEEVFQQHFAPVGFDAGSPTRHFIDFAIPLGACEALLPDDVFVVASETAFGSPEAA